MLFTESGILLWVDSRVVVFWQKWHSTELQSLDRSRTNGQTVHICVGICGHTRTGANFLRYDFSNLHSPFQTKADLLINQRGSRLEMNKILRLWLGITFGKTFANYKQANIERLVGDRSIACSSADREFWFESQFFHCFYFHIRFLSRDTATGQLPIGGIRLGMGKFEPVTFRIEQCYADRYRITGYCHCLSFGNLTQVSVHTRPLCFCIVGTSRCILW